MQDRDDHHLKKNPKRPRSLKDKYIMMKYLYFVRLAPKVNVKNRNIIRNICHDENLKISQCFKPRLINQACGTPF